MRVHATGSLGRLANPQLDDVGPVLGPRPGGDGRDEEVIARRALALSVMTIGFSGSVRLTSRHYEAGLHLWSARHYSRLCIALESEKRSAAPLIDIQHRAYASSAVLSSAVFLESLVNEVFQDAADATEDQVNTRIAPLGARCIAVMGEYWQASDNGRNVLTLSKLQMALLFAEKPKFDRGANPYQDAKLLIDIRNGLVHFRPAWRTAGEETKLEEGLKGKFAENSLLTGTGNPWFPDKCLAAGCAEWSWRTAHALADEWTGRLGLPRYYGDDNDRKADWPHP